MKPYTLPYHEFYCQGDHILQFLYGHDKQRRKTTHYDENGLAMEKYFVGLYEKETFPYNTTLSKWDWDFHEHNLSRSLDLVNMFSEAYEFSSLSEENSLAELIPITIEMSSSGNGRVYDPILGRMLSPDKYIQDPLFSQSYNRYSYVWNNPLRYTDPSGDFVVVGMAIGAVVGAYIGGSVANNTINIAQWEWDGNTARGMITGAMFGAFAGAGVGAAFAGKLGTKAMAIAKLNAPTVKSGLVSGGLNMMYNYEEGQSLGTSLGYFGAGFLGGVVGFEAGTLVGMIAGGTGNVGVLGADKGSEATFREYAQKFVSGAINSYAGKSVAGTKTFGTEVDYMKMANGKYFGGSKTTAKVWRYGWLNQASDFAHSNEETFKSRTLGERLLMFGAAGTSSLIKGVGGRYFDYYMQQTIHATYNNNPDYLPWVYEKSNQKLFIQHYKYLFSNLKIN